ncbi:MAG: DUF2723 domain-containing protein [Flavobacteriales bacterium]|nr:DUF2723 domain-containing protein [Flavobacteriales bacterium]
MDYRKINNILGWVVFVIATFVYLATLEETTSLWDCGEYITTSNKLEVGHPPGAPMFMMLGRLFSAFSSPENAAYMVNAMSAVSSSLAILFLFWTISMLARKIALKNNNDLNDKGTQIAIFGSAAVGALAYTFTDTFWFSAVEGEVYAMSSFFTALVFWAIFKWEIETEKHDDDVNNGRPTSHNPNRWLIFISYMIGLSIGVHLLNLLAIPAIAFVIYFKKTKEVDIKGLLLTGIIGMATLAMVQNVIIPNIPNVADVFERAFTNNFGMGFNSGFIFFVVLVVSLLTFGIFYTSRKGKSLWNNIIVSLTMLLIGYSSFTMIVVRSNANPPLDENNPETLSSFVSYLNRDQYGGWPLLKGPYWNSPGKPGCTEESLESPKSFFMKAFVAELEHTTNSFSVNDAVKIQEIVAPLGIPLQINQQKDGKISVSTPQFRKWVYYNGTYVEPNSSIAADLGDPLKYELSFITLFDFDDFKAKVDAANENLIASNIDFKLSMSSEASPKYVNTMAGKAGERKYDEEYVTFLPRMYRQGKGAEYMEWINYDNHEHNTPLPKVENLQGTNRAEQYFNLVQAANSIQDPNIKAQYEEYANMLKEDGLYKPNFFNENLAYMFKYQLDWMYFRYFMWNFAGRQNDIQGQGMNGGARMLLDGNWISGIKFLDSQRLGNQENLPEFITQNVGYNRYYLLPLILGLIGLIFHTVKAPKDMFAVLLLFFFTGLAIVLYLNQKPMEPRERDYAYAASFYAFAVWIGLGVFALFDAAKQFNKKKLMQLTGITVGGSLFILVVEFAVREVMPMGTTLLYMSIVGVGTYALFAFLGDKFKNTTMTSGIATTLCMVVPIVLAVENWDDHDRSNRTTARDFAYNYLLSCSEKSEDGKGAILFTNGDNDTFPLWYLQEVEEQRTDVRVANMSLLGTDWHISQMKRQAYDSEPLEINMNEFSYRNGTRDYVIVTENNAKKYISGKKWVEINSNSEKSVNDLLTIWGGKNLPATVGDKSLSQYSKDAILELMRNVKAAQIGATFKSNDIALKNLPADMLNAINGVKNDSLDLSDVQNIVSFLSTKTDPKERKEVLASVIYPIQDKISSNLDKWQQVYYSIDEAMAFILDDNHYINSDQTCNQESYIDFKAIYLPVDKSAALKHGIITEDQMAKCQDTIKWRLQGGVIYKSDLAVMDLLSNYEWNRPIYFASLSKQGLQANYGLAKYMQSEGLAFKITPIEFGANGGVNFDKMYNLMMDKENGFQWGNMKTPGVLVDYYTMRMVYNLRVQIMKFTEDLISAGKYDMAVDVLDRAFEEMPIENSQVAADDICFYLCANYYDAGAKEKGDKLAAELTRIKLEEIRYYAQQDEPFFKQMLGEFGKSMQQLELLRSAADPEGYMQYSTKLQAVYTDYQQGINQLEMQAKTGALPEEEVMKQFYALGEKFKDDQIKVGLEVYNVPSANGAGFANMAYADQKLMNEVLALAKKKFLDTRNTEEYRKYYKEAKNFPKSFIQLWDPLFDFDL